MAADAEHALALLETESYVRKASVQRDRLRLYVALGESAMPVVLRRLDGNGFDL